MLVYQRVVPVQGTHLWGVVFPTNALMISDKIKQSVCRVLHLAVAANHILSILREGRGGLL